MADVCDHRQRFDLGLVGLVAIPAHGRVMLGRARWPTVTTGASSSDLPDRGRRRGPAWPLGSLAGWINEHFILSAVFLLGIGRAFEATAMKTMLPAVVPAELFQRERRRLVVAQTGRHHQRAGDRRLDLRGEPDRVLTRGASDVHLTRR